MGGGKRVYCNPPYGTKAKDFIKKLAEHGNGIALIFARTETRVWFDEIWAKANAILFIKGRLRFYTPKGIKAGTAGSPSALIAYGQNNVEALERIKEKGKMVYLR